MKVYEWGPYDRMNLRSRLIMSRYLRNAPGVSMAAPTLLQQATIVPHNRGQHTNLATPSVPTTMPNTRASVACSMR